LAAGSKRRFVKEMDALGRGGKEILKPLKLFMEGGEDGNIARNVGS